MIAGAAFRENKGMESAFSKDQLIELGGIVLSHLASTPEMIVGTEEALAGVVGTVAQAMAKDDKLLLCSGDWLEIARVAAREAAINPARLFKFDPESPTQTLAAQVIGVILDSANSILEEQSLKDKTILFGETLREAVITVLKATSGNPQAARNSLSTMGLLFSGLTHLVTMNPDRFGSKEWINLLPGVLEGRPLEDLTVEGAMKLLREKVR